MEAVILAGGLGTRLREAVPNLPKSLAPIGEQPFLDYLLGWLRGQGVNEVILAVGHRRTAIARYYDRHQPRGMRVRYSVEATPLGTAGALRNVGPFLSNKEFFVLNGDSIFDVDLRQMLSFHRRHRSEVTLALAAQPQTGRYGSVVLDARKRIKAFLEKQPASARRSENTGGPRWISGGLYLMNKAALRHMPRQHEVSLEKEFFPRLIGTPFYGFPWDGFFIDIGVPEDYRRAQAELPKRFTLC